MRVQCALNYYLTHVKRVIIARIKGINKEEILKEFQESDPDGRAHASRTRARKAVLIKDVTSVRT